MHRTRLNSSPPSIPDVSQSVAMSLAGLSQELAQRLGTAFGQNDVMLIAFQRKLEGPKVVPVIVDRKHGGRSVSSI
jgi:hypothetical protein